MLVSLIFFVIWIVRVRGIYSLCVVAVVVVKMVFFLFCFLIGRVILFCYGRVFYLVDAWSACGAISMGVGFVS